MWVIRNLAAGLAAASMVLAVPAAAAPMSNAEKIRKLDIMLMVTALRCRHGKDNFQPDYERFTTRQITLLNKAAADLRRQIAAGQSPRAANRALDKISTKMANQYGQGHPWLGCSELRQVTRNLVDVKGEATMVEAADQLLSSTARPVFALRNR